MPYNIVEHIQKMKVTIPIIEVMKVPLKKENLMKSSEDEKPRGNWLEVVFIC